MKNTRRARMGVMLISLILPGVMLAADADDKTCEQLGVEQEALKALGVEKDMAKGYEWARANLGQGDLNLIRQFIEISERVKFRCAGVTAAKLDLTAPGSTTPTGGLTPPPPLPVKRNAVRTIVKPATASSATATGRARAQPQKPAAQTRAGQS